MTSSLRLIAFTKYSRRAASTRQRLLQYLPCLEAGGISIEYHPLLGDDYLADVAAGGGYSRIAVARSYMRRLAQITNPVGADAIWIYAELFPYLPAWFETLVLRSGKPVIYDCDDAFFLSHAQSPHPVIRRFLGGKLEPLLRGARMSLCGNTYLRDQSARFCPDSVVLPTVVDTTVYRPRTGMRRPGVVIGWIGSPSTWRYLAPLMPLLRELAAMDGVTVRIVGAGGAASGSANRDIEMIEWSEATEIDDVQAMDIGIMPTVDEPWALGKCGYKLIQYMACGLPVVSSPIGVATTIVDHGKNGFLARNVDEWRRYLLLLIGDAAIREKLGAAGRCKIEERYSLSVHGPRFAELIRKACATPKNR